MLKGLDLSSYQAGIGNVGQEFVIVKATEGTSYVNPYMNAQLQTAKLRSQYHFASGGNVIAEANHFLSTYIKGNIPALDYEADAVWKWSVSDVKQWLDYVYAKTGIKPLLYMSLAVENERDWSSCTDYPLWVAQYNTKNPEYGWQERKLYGHLSNWKSMAVFQYSSTTRLPGWNGNLDADLLLVSWDSLTSTVREEDDEMNWHPEVKYDELGRFKTDGANIYSDSNLNHVVAQAKANTYKINRATNGAVQAGTNQWFSQADGITKINPLAVNAKAHGKCRIITDDAYTQNETRPGKGIKHLPRNSTWNVLGRSGKYLLVGNEATGKYIDGNKTRIIL